jgi:hypothetical protein
VAVSCEHATEPSGFIEGGKYIKQLSDHQFLIKDFAQLSHSTRFYLVSLLLKESGMSDFCIAKS